MSKKSRKRNRKILGALAAGLGAMALMKGRQGTRSVNPVGGVDQIAADAVTGTVYPGSNQAKAVVAAPKKIDHGIAYQSSRAAGNYPDHVPAPKRVNNVLVKGRINADMGRKQPFHPSQGNLYKPGFTMSGDTRGWKSGGRVKGCGIAKRGLGRAMKKGRK